MSIALAIFAVILGVLGIVGSIVPALPGPPLSWFGLLLMFLRSHFYAAGDPFSSTALLIWLGITILVTVLDYIVPSWMTKISGGSKYAGWGATIGLLLGMFIPPVGIILGSITGAFLAEIIFAGSSVWTSMKSALGAFAGFIFGTGMKLIVSGLMLWKIIVYI